MNSNERDFQMYLNFEQHRLSDRFFSNVGSEVLESLNAAQKKGLTRALVRSFLSPSPKIVDLRCSFPWFKKRFYLDFFLGSETRQGEPRYYSRYLSRSHWLGNTVFLLGTLGVLVCAAVGLWDILSWIIP